MVTEDRDVKTAITELFKIEHLIIQGGMHYVGFAELAAAVSSAGGLGIITGLTQRMPRCQSPTSMIGLPASTRKS
jgi:NAD(P)H-dependent flavin oxidoreductase YrpB (nitropropane dioxygenase family)